MQANSYTSNSNKEKITWYKVILFVVVLALFIFLIGEAFEKISSKNAIATNYKKTLKEFYETEPNTIDMVFIGSSHSYCTFDTELVDTALNINSFNMGSPLQHADSSYYVLREVLNYQTPKTVVFEIYWDMLDDDFELKQAQTVLSTIENNKLKKEYINKVFPLNEKVKYFFKPVRYQQDVFAYANSKLKNFVGKYMVNNTPTGQTNGTEYYKNKGFIYSNIIIPESEYNETNQFVGLDGSKWNFSKTQKNYVKKMVELCRDKDINIVFVTAPIANVSLDYIKDYDALHNKIANFAKELNVPYIDYNVINMDDHILNNENFRDDAHLNYSGVEIVMKDFIKWIKDK